LPGAGQGTSERQLFSRVLKFFHSSAHPGSALSAVMASSGAVQAMFLFSALCYDTVSYLSTQRYAPKEQPAAALLPWAFKLLSLAVALPWVKKPCPAANRNGRPKLNLSFITRFNPIYSWT